MRKSAPRNAIASPGAPSAFEQIITIIAADDVLSVPSRDGGDVTMLGNIVMRPNAKMETFYGTVSKTETGFDAEGDEDAIRVMQKVKAEHPGNAIGSKEFAAHWIGIPCYVIVDFCDANAPEFYGTKCAPMNLMPAKAQGSDGDKFTFEFKQFKGTRYLPGNYAGAKVLNFANQPAAFALAILAANSTQQYNLAPSATASTAITFTSVTLGQDATFTLVGAGGANPATLANIVTGAVQQRLKGGISWVALPGASITFKVLFDGSTTLLIEQSRS